MEKNNFKIAGIGIVCLILGAMMGRVSPISNTAQNDNSSKVYVSAEIPGNSQKKQEFSGKNRNFQEKINVNSASKMQLKKLDGVGSKKADLIIKGRPYKSIEELLERGIIGRIAYPKIEPNITVGE